MPSSHPFKIYSSSAGSGKTYTLTKEYLKLALQQDNPTYYKQILAITFTNDAANEMKERILSALKGFSDENSLSESRQASNQVLLQTIVEELRAEGEHVTATEIRRRAGRTFRSILHDYSDFAVSTIDSFVNRLVSAFTEELNIPFNYEVDLDAADLLNNAIDRLLNRIGEAEEAVLSEMLEGYAMEKADEGKSWNYLPDDLAGFGMHLLNEKVFEAVGKLQQVTLQDFRDFRSKIREYLQLLQGQVASLADEALQLIAENGLDSKCFVGGSNGIHGYFSKIVEDPEGRIIWAPTEAFIRGIEGSEWAPKAVKEAQRTKVNAIAPGLLEYYEAIERLKGEFILLEAILRHFYKLSVIHEINTELEAIKSEKNVVHISDFNKAIINIVLQEPVPFIYERLGERYNHIMIDEFQDTSVLQWNNLLPLIENSVAKGHFSMIVGDAKQAIYGWRGGDMEQIVYLSQKRFAELSKKHQQSDLLDYRYETLEFSLKSERLTTNYRSTAEIIEFNNNLFRLLSGLYNHDKRLLADVYDAFFEQEIPPQPRTGGHIQVDFVSKELLTLDASPQELANPYKFNTFDALLNIIYEAKAGGYSYQDMAILNRSNVKGKEIANFLQEQGIEVISQEALLLQSARSVQLVMALFKVIHEPEHTLHRYEALHLFHTYILGTLPDATGEAVKEILTGATTEPFYAYFTEKGYTIDPLRIQQSGIYELSEKVIQVFELFSKPRQAAYLFRLLDVILEFSIKQSNHLADFMEYWEQKKEKLCINTPKEWEAITVSSIHKSKGLEYPVVIVPFADWEFSPNKEDLLWVSLEKENLHPATYLLHELPIRSAAISPVKDLNRTPLRDQYSRESEKVFVESLNTLYVALTRPTDRLYLLTKKDDFEKKSDTSRVNVSYLLYQYIAHFGEWEPERNTYIFHQGLPKPGTKSTVTENETWTLRETQYADWQDKARLSRKAAIIFDPLTLEKQRDISQKLCYALSRLTYAKDLDDLLLTFQAEGLVDITEAVEFERRLKALLSHEWIQPCFSPEVRIMSAHNIISARALSLPSPDRVVVNRQTISILNFLPGSPSDADSKRLQRYSKFLKEMGYETVEAILVNVADSSVQKISV
ncbi:UvrD-helicase domain-containing protein [Rhodocytophaga rosea]|uniref:DNA 3'-5' helicase n=1 Tax=Rhodocytophaga rosea TaxID=2704465 RepID=A0A6C0GKG7_9BACT|nr:UvrD-helicase domain-containing protein [Rhodocytophaga rosea]QHT68526.1 UvrD-helicase domain-containing protein [Rhodocytophaga rosea]